VFVDTLRDKTTHLTHLGILFYTRGARLK